MVPQPRIRILPRRQQLIARGAGGVEARVGIVLAVAEQVAATGTIRCQTIRCQFIIIGTIRCQFIIIGQFGVSSSLLLPLHQVSKLDSQGTIRCQGDNSVSVRTLLLPLGDNSVSVHHYCFPCIKSVSWIQRTIRCQFIIIASLEGTIRCQFIIIASLEGTIRCQKFGVMGQFGVSSSLLLPLRDNSVSVHHYAGQFGVSSSLLLPLHQVGKLTIRCRTIRCQFIIIASLAQVECHGGQFGVSSSLLLPLHQVGKLHSWEHSRPTGDDLIYHAINRGNNLAHVLGPDGERDMFLGDLARTKARYPLRSSASA